MTADAPWRERPCCWGGMGESLNHLSAALGSVPCRGHPEGAALLIPKRLGKVTVGTSAWMKCSPCSAPG